jgi:hypothetical protein
MEQLTCTCLPALSSIHARPSGQFLFNNLSFIGYCEYVVRGVVRDGREEPTVIQLYLVV